MLMYSRERPCHIFDTSHCGIYSNCYYSSLFCVVRIKVWAGLRLQGIYAWWFFTSDTTYVLLLYLFERLHIKQYFCRLQKYRSTHRYWTCLWGCQVGVVAVAKVAAVIEQQKRSRESFGVQGTLPWGCNKMSRTKGYTECSTGLWYLPRQQWESLVPHGPLQCGRRWLSICYFWNNL